MISSESARTLVSSARKAFRSTSPRAARYAPGLALGCGSMLLLQRAVRATSCPASNQPMLQYMPVNLARAETPILQAAEESQGAAQRPQRRTVHNPPRESHPQPAHVGICPALIFIAPPQNKASWGRSLTAAMIAVPSTPVPWHNAISMAQAEKPIFRQGEVP